jgi:ubiquinone/menaquinone biosynthesis C-methylase UbiE
MTWLFGRRRGAAVASRPVGRKRAGESRDDYIFGEGEAEMSRLNFQHYMFRYAFGQDYSAPIRTPRAVLDVACGTGRWAREMARRFPNASVIGFDLNREQLEASLAEGLDTLPENCTFVSGDALQPIQFPEGSFDFVMARACSSFIPVLQWPQVIGEMARVTRPGGWVEVRDFGLARSSNAALNELTLKFASLAQARGLHPGSGPFLKQYLTSARLRDVYVKHVTIRSGNKRGTRAGQLTLIDYLALMERITPIVERAGVDSAQHWQMLVGQVRAETRMAPDDQYVETELTAAYGRR